ncbi:MAG: phosphate ABC transporter permease PstA [Phycisphaerae bacterium]|nr:phosphate ABC transporter permease PstA [Phycisphaerae bacterium]
MNIPWRMRANSVFTVVALLSVLLIVASLLVILLPILWRGGSAVVFRGTVEFRRMQLEQFQRGDTAAVRAEVERAAGVRRHAYEIIDRFSAGLDTAGLETKARQLHREFGAQLRNRNLDDDDIFDLRELSGELRDEFLAALESSDNAEALGHLETILSRTDDERRLHGTLAAAFFDMAREYRDVVGRVDLSHREEYLDSLQQVKEAMQNLLGPQSSERLPAIVMEQYGATRWDQAQQHLDHLLWSETWVAVVPGQPLVKTRAPMEERFAGTELAELFPYVRDNAEAMLRPEWTFYWRYFLDDSMSGHYFGGVGPEILGTLMVTVLAILLALPVGVITAAYVVEYGRETVMIKALRMCVNTLAGVPSIVFGLFGLAFFVIYLQPKLGLPQGSSILAGGLTLSLLVLPVIIRASEEAIRSVPPSYKEAALALGASRFRCFVTVTLPAAMPGILTGLILSMSRAAGETAPILFTAGVAMGPIPTSIAQPTRTLAYSSYDMAVGDKMAMLAPHNQFGMVMTLVAVVLILNITAIIVRGRMARKLRGR